VNRRRTPTWRGSPAYRTPNKPDSLFGEALLLGISRECPLWVISGHVGPHEKVSALPPTADILHGNAIDDVAWKLTDIYNNEAGHYISRPREEQPCKS